MAKFIISNDANSVTNTGEAWLFRANDRPVGTMTNQLGGNGCSIVSWEIVDSAWSKVIAKIPNAAPGATFMIDNSGNLGLGTDTPAATLDVYSGNLRVNGTSNYASSAKIWLGDLNAGVAAVRGQGLKFGVYKTSGGATLGTNSMDAMVIQEGSGRVGIGATSPSHPLHIYDGGNSVYARWERSTGNMYIGSDSIGGAVGTTGNIPLYFYTGDGTERMRLTCQGNLGIGTSSPTYNLVVGTDLGNLSTNSTTSVVGNTGNSSYFVVGQAFNKNFQFNWQYCSTATSAFAQIVTYGYANPIQVDGSSIVMQTQSGGKVGIGTSNPCTTLVVKGGAASSKTDLLSISTCSGTGAQPVLRFDTLESNSNVLGRISVCDTGQFSADMIFEVSCYKIGANGNTVERMRIRCDGNIGINTSTPGSYKLYVNGSFYSAGSSCEYKTSICNYNTDSCMFMKLKPVTYQYKDEWCHLGKELKSGTQIGLIAEHTAEVFPELAILKEEDEQKVVRNVDYEKLSIVLLAEVQKLRQEVDQLKNK